MDRLLDGVRSSPAWLLPWERGGDASNPFMEAVFSGGVALPLLGGLVPPIGVPPPLPDVAFEEAAKRTFLEPKVFKLYGGVGTVEADKRDRERALLAWYRILISVGGEGAGGMVARAFLAHSDPVAGQAAGVAVVADVFGQKASGALLIRSSAVNQYIKWATSVEEQLFPMTEERAYKYVVHLRGIRAPPTRASSFRGLWDSWCMQPASSRVALLLRPPGWAVPPSWRSRGSAPPSRRSPSPWCSSASSRSCCSCPRWRCRRRS
jgi:hypothetical protein